MITRTTLRVISEKEVWAKIENLILDVRAIRTGQLRAKLAPRLPRLPAMEGTMLKKNRIWDLRRGGGRL